MKAVVNQPCQPQGRSRSSPIRTTDVFVFLDDVPLPYFGGRERGFQTGVEVETPRGKAIRLALPISPGVPTVALVRYSVPLPGWTGNASALPS